MRTTAARAPGQLVAMNSSAGRAMTPRTARMMPLARTRRVRAVTWTNGVVGATGARVFVGVVELRSAGYR